MLALKDVKKSFAAPDGSRLPVLEIADFRRGDGEQMALVGRSGCGKTTLLHVIAGISRPDAGSVSIDDGPLPDDRGRVRPLPGRAHRLRLPDLQPPARLHRPGKRAPGHAVRRRGGPIGPGPEFARPRRAGPSRTLAPQAGDAFGGRAAAGGGRPGPGQSPKLLLADEPTANVDAGHQKQVFDLLRDTCREENVALLLVTHSAEVARQFDRVEELEKFNQVGKTKAEG